MRGTEQMSVFWRKRRSLQLLLFGIALIWLGLRYSRQLPDGISGAGSSGSSGSSSGDHHSPRVVGLQDDRVGVDARGMRESQSKSARDATEGASDVREHVLENIHMKIKLVSLKRDSDGEATLRLVSVQSKVLLQKDTGDDAAAARAAMAATELKLKPVLFLLAWGTGDDDGGGGGGGSGGNSLTNEDCSMSNFEQESDERMSALFKCR